jgi:predicted RecB family nuclease
MPTGYITKELFLKARRCPALGWFIRNQPTETEPTEGERFRMEQGVEIGRLARSIFPTGRMIPSGTNGATARITQTAIADPDLTAAFEATFVAGNYVTKPDILLRDGNGWRVIEVKSSLAETGQLNDLIDDLTYTVMVFKRAGMNVTAAELMLIRRDYRNGDPTTELFQRLDQTDAVNERLVEFDGLWDSIDTATSGELPPKAKLVSACRSCPHFNTDCLGNGIEHSVLSLPNLHANRLAKLANDGIVDLRQLPPDFPLTPTQQHVVDCIRSGQPWVSPSLGAALEGLQYPVRYLDFETVATAIPLYDDVAPFKPVTTQYSIHCRPQPGTEPEHVDYLADPLRDCERELAHRLLADCGTSGSIVVYSQFEKTRIKALAERFPDLSADLLKLTDRLFDLLDVIRNGYYNIGFGGSFSIKTVLPVLVPDLSYDGLAIGDGDTATARFVRAARGLCSSNELERLRVDLLAYCQQDTLAMVRLHDALLTLSGGTD